MLDTGLVKDWTCRIHADKGEKYIGYCHVHNEFVCERCMPKHRECKVVESMKLKFELEENKPKYIGEINRIKNFYEDRRGDVMVLKEKVKNDMEARNNFMKNLLTEIMNSMQAHYIQVCKQLDAFVEGVNGFPKECEEKIDTIERLCGDCVPRDVLSPEKFRDFCLYFKKISDSINKPILDLEQKTQQIKANSEQFLDSTKAADLPLQQLRDIMVMSTKIGNEEEIKHKFKVHYGNTEDPMSKDEFFKMFRKFVDDFKLYLPPSEAIIKDAFESQEIMTDEVNCSQAFSMLGDMLKEFEKNVKNSHKH